MLKASFLFLFFACSVHAASLSENIVITMNNEKLSLQQLSNSKKFLVVIAHGIECPVMRKNLQTFNDLYSKFSDRVSFVMVNGVKNEGQDIIKQESQDYKIQIPIVKDVDQKILKALDIGILSSTALIDLETNKVLYTGAVDDRVNLDVAKPEAKNRYLEEALTSALAGKKIKTQKTQAYGCKILIN